MTAVKLGRDGVCYWRQWCRVAVIGCVVQSPPVLPHSSKNDVAVCSQRACLIREGGNRQGQSTEHRHAMRGRAAMNWKCIQHKSSTVGGIEHERTPQAATHSVLRVRACRMRTHETKHLSGAMCDVVQCRAMWSDI